MTNEFRNMFIHYPRSNHHLYETAVDSLVLRRSTVLLRAHNCVITVVGVMAKVHDDPFKTKRIPYPLRIKGSVLGRIWFQILLIAIFSSTITCISELSNTNLGIQPTVITTLGFVVGLALSLYVSVLSCVRVCSDVLAGLRQLTQTGKKADKHGRSLAL